MSALSRKAGAPSADRAPSDAQGASAAFHARIMPPPPSAAVGLTRQGLALFAVGDFRRAEQAFRTVVEVAPHQALAWNNLALVLVSLGEHGEAAAALERSVGLDPTQVATWISLAAAFLRLDRADAAEEACVAALALDAGNAAAWQTRAFASVQAENFHGAAEAFARTIALAGDSAALRFNLGVALMRCSQFEEAAASLAAALALDPTLAAALECKQVCDVVLAAIAGDMAMAGVTALAAPDLGRILKTALLLLNGAGERAAAARVSEAWVRVSPGNIEATHLRDAALSRPVDRQPAALVAQHFDGIADDFDDRLVRRLGYEGPGRLLGLITSRIVADGTLDVLDLGCGTGLCAPLLRPYARRLAGVDLSARMLAKARALKLYDRLATGDLLDALSGRPGRRDLLVAADTLPYLGDLAPVFDGAARVLRPGGWFAFSTETIEGDSFVLKADGRYAHGRRYVERMTAGRFEVAGEVTAPLRRAAGRTVVGDFFLLRRLRAA